MYLLSLVRAADLAGVADLADKEGSHGPFGRLITGQVTHPQSTAAHIEILELGLGLGLGLTYFSPLPGPQFSCNRRSSTPQNLFSFSLILYRTNHKHSLCPLTPSISNMQSMVQLWTTNPVHVH